MSSWEPFTERARRSITLAQEEANRLGSNFIGTEHILLGIISEGENLAAKVLGSLGITLAKVRDDVVALVERADQTVQQEMVFTPRAKRVIELAFEEARLLNHNYIGTEHLLLGLAREGECVAARVLTRLGAGAAQLRTTILGLLGAGHAEAALRATEVLARPFDPPTERVTITAAHAIIAAKESAMRAGRRIYDVEHLLYGIAHVQDSPASGILAGNNAAPETIRQHLPKGTENRELNEREVLPSAAVGLCFQKAFGQMASMSRLMLDTELLLFALVDAGDHRGMEILKALGADIEGIRVQLKTVLYERQS